MKKIQNLPIFPVFSRFSRFPRLSRFCADFGGGLKKNGISCSKDDYLCINYIVLALIWVVIHIFTICGSKVMEFWKFVGIFGKSGQNRGKIGIESGNSDFFGIFWVIPSILMVFHNFPSFFVLSMIFGDFRGGGVESTPPQVTEISKRPRSARVKVDTYG